VAARPNRRALTATALVAIVGGAVAWIVAGRVWAHGTVGDTMVMTRFSATGNDLSGAVTALGLTAIAGALALFATRRLGRLLVGVLLTAVGIGVVATAAAAHSASHAHSVLAAEAKAKGVSGTVTYFGDNPCWTVAVLGGLVIAAAGLHTVLRSRTWPGMSSRYENPAARAAKTEARAAAASGSAKGIWDALDRGEDPTGDGAEAAAESGAGSDADPGSGPPATPRTDH
jgi:uncharacterized membrane protein (TIGR02234 family)